MKKNTSDQHCNVCLTQSVVIWMIYHSVGLSEMFFCHLSKCFVIVSFFFCSYFTR